jgi:hypothetical protein
MSVVQVNVCVSPFTISRTLLSPVGVIVIFVTGTVIYIMILPLYPGSRITGICSACEVYDIY